MRRYLVTIAVIFVVASGWDNVSWGSIDVKIVPPPSTEDGAEVEGDDRDAPAPLNVDGPILLAGMRDGARATLTLVGEVDGDVLRAFPDTASPGDAERLESLTAPGAAWILFSEGARVGRMVVDATGTADGFCGSRVTVSGVVELVPPAAGAERLLALPAAAATDRAYGQYRALAHDYGQRVASLQIVQQAIPEHGAQWPRLGVLDARKHIQAFDLDGPTGPYLAATFMYEDELAVSPPGRSALRPLHHR